MIVVISLAFLALGIGLFLYATPIFHSGGDIYRIPQWAWVKVRNGTHLLNFDPDSGWYLIDLRNATEEDIDDHVYHMSQGSKADIELNAQYPDELDSIEDAACGYLDPETLEDYRRQISDPLYGMHAETAESNLNWVKSIDLRRAIETANRRESSGGQRTGNRNVDGHSAGSTDSGTSHNRRRVVAAEIGRRRRV